MQKFKEIFFEQLEKNFIEIAKTEFLKNGNKAIILHGFI